VGDIRPFSGGNRKAVSSKPPDPRTPPLGRSLYLAGFLVSILVIIRLAVAFLAVQGVDLITWDQAARANEAVLLSKELAHLRIFTFILHVFKLNWWPPLQPLITVPFCFILGPSFLAFILPSLIAFPIAVFSLLFLYENLCPGRIRDRALGFSLLFSLAVTSPLLLASATWVMTEILGIALACLVLGFYFRGRRFHSTGSYKICALLFFSLWTLKYNYGIFAGVILLILEIERSREAIRLRVSGVRVRAFFSKPVLFPAYVMILFILWVAATGGISLHWGSVRFSSSGIYNPLMFLYQYVFVISLVALKKNWPRIRASFKRGQKELLVWGVLPLTVFLAFPDKIKAIVKNFEAGRRLHHEFSSGQVGYYFRSITQDYSLLVPVGIMVLLLLGVVLFKFPAAPLGIRLLAAYFVAGLVYLTFFFNLKESRYLAPFVPALWVSSAWAAEWLLRRVSPRIKNSLAVVVLLTALAVSFLSPLPIQKALDPPGAPGSHYPEAFRSLIDPVLDATKDSARIFVSGIEDSALGPLLELKLQISHYRQNNYRAAFKDFNKESDARTALQNIIAQKEVDTIVLYVGRKAKGWSFLAKEAERIRRSGGYKLIRRSRYREPFSVQLIILKST
jgi:hypothetical protein